MLLELWSKLRLPDAFDRDLRLLLISMASRRIALGFLFLVRSIYFGLLGYSYTTVGILLSVATLVAAIRQVVFGMLSDRVGRKVFFVMGAIFTTTRLIVFATRSDFWSLVFGQAIGALGEGSGAGQPVVSGYISDKTDEFERSDVFTTLGITNALTTTIGFILSGLPAYFENRFGLSMVQAHSWLWWIGAFFSAFSLVFLLPMKDIKPEEDDLEVAETVEAGFMGVHNWGAIAKFSLVRSTSGLGFGLIGSLLPLYFSNRFGVGSEILGPIYAVSRLFTIFSYLLIPSLIEKFGEIGALTWTRIISALFSLSFAFVEYYPLALGLLFIYRIITHFGMPIRQSFATSLVPSDETATAVGVSNFFRMTLRTLAPTAAGYMFEAVSLSLPFISGTFLIVINAGLYRGFYGTIEPEGEEILLED
ncbi:MFS transporter [Candidatus Bathyarchaeota archaeon]|nr:MFS transporter [Candidatus Bathyarchaeota archaeon]